MDFLMDSNERLEMSNRRLVEELHLMAAHVDWYKRKSITQQEDLQHLRETLNDQLTQQVNYEQVRTIESLSWRCFADV